VTGVVLSETLQDGARVTATTYDTDGNRLNPGRSLRVQVTAKAGDRLEAQGPDQVRAYDERGLLVEEALEAAPGQLRGRKFSYDTEGHRLSESTFATGAPDGAGRVTSYVYGADGRPATTSTSFTAPSGPVAPLVDTYRYSPEGWVLEHLDEKGVTTSYTYDSRGRVLTATSAGGPALTYAYPTERTTTWSSSAGASGSESRDGFGRPFQRVRGEGVTETYGYDVLGRRTRLQETVPGGGTRTSAWTFDPLSRVVTSALAGATTEVRISHAEAGGLALTTTTQGDLAQTLGLDVLGQQVLVQDPAAETRTQFDGLGRPTRITTGPPGGGGPQVRAFTYTAFGDLASRTDPETGTTTFEAHNALGAPTRIREAGGRTTVVAYDGLGRVTSRTNPDTEDSLEFTYAGPHRASASSRSGNRVSSVALEYDALGRCVGETLRPNADSTWTIGYGYDAFGRRDQVVYPDGRIVRYAFDPKTGQPGTATLGQGGQLVHLDFNPWGNRAGAVFGSGAREAWGYDSTGTRMTRWTVAPVGAGTPPTDRAYAYDALDHLQAAGEWTSLAHDPLGRLTAAEGPGRAFAYGHDAFHNLIRARASGAVPTGSVDFALDPLADNRLPSLANGVPGWDLNAAGEATSLGTGLAADPVLRLAWDGLGRLASTTRAEGVQTFGYFPTGLRSLQLEAGHPERSRAYVYTQEGLLLGEYSGEGGSLTWLRDVIHLGGQAVAEIDGAGIHELHCDPQGTPRLITDGGTGAQAGLQAFGPFGEPLGLDEGYRPLTGYTGHIQTDPSGLIYMRGRFYSPAWRRFLSSDRGADPNQLNAYAYALGSPLMATDPSGMASDYAFKSYANWLADLGHDLFGSGNNPGGNAGAMEAFLRYFGRGMPSATVEVLGRFAPVDSYIGAVALANAGLGGNGAWGKSGGHAANGMSQSTKSRASFWNVVSNNQRQVSVKRLLPKWFCGPVSNMTGAVGLGNSMSKFGKLPLLEIASGGSVLAGAAGIGTVLSAGATVYEAGTWVGSLWVGVLYELFPAHVEEMGNVNP
jgi:RHS repeat-associated protein